jgi:signal transduction histidine kinase
MVNDSPVTRKKHSFFYNWGSVTTIVPDIRSQELAARATWFINMRWLAILACAVGAVIAMTGIVPADVNPIDFVITIAFLSFTNLIYTKIGRNLVGDQTRRRDLQRLLLWQMFGDFTALCFLTYSLGCIETPMGALFMAHIILATLLFSRWQSLMIAAAGWVFASAPLLLELAGIIPVQSIFKSEFRQAVSHDVGITLGFVLASGGVYLFCWYLVSEISSSLKLRERQLEDAHQMLIKIDKEKTQSTLLATHELKAPFAAIKSYVYTLRDGYCGTLPEKARSVILRIGDRCDQITNRITDIIHLSNLRTLVVTEMNLVPVDLISVLSEEAREGALIGEPHKIKIINLTENHPPIRIMGSYEHLKTLFSNLIQNAINYSNENTGRVVVSVETSPGKAEVSVQDNGIGIPKEALDKIFNDHFRSKNAVAHHAGGTGLGLSIVKEIVVLHGASIQVESIVHRGSSFTVRFNTIEGTQENMNYGKHTNSRR